MSNYTPENEKVSEPLRLKSLRQGNVYFDKGDDTLNTIGQDGLVVECPVTRHLIKELDRRLCQLWDKVVFERENNLVNYKSIDIRFNHDDAVTPNPLPLNDKIIRSF